MATPGLKEPLQPIGEPCKNDSEGMKRNWDGHAPLLGRSLGAAGRSYTTRHVPKNLPLPFHIRCVCWLDVLMNVLLLWRLLAHLALQPYSDTSRHSIIQVVQLVLGTAGTVFVLSASTPNQKMRGPVIVSVDVLWVSLHICHAFAPLGLERALRATRDIIKTKGHSPSVVWSSVGVWYLAVRPGLLQLPFPCLLLDLTAWLLNLALSTAMVERAWLLHGSGTWCVPGWLVFLMAALGGLVIDQLVASPPPRGSIQGHASRVAVPLSTSRCVSEVEGCTAGRSDSGTVKAVQGCGTSSDSGARSPRRGRGVLGQAGLLSRWFSSANARQRTPASSSSSCQAGPPSTAVHPTSPAPARANASDQQPLAVDPAACTPSSSAPPSAPKLNTLARPKPARSPTVLHTGEGAGLLPAPSPQLDSLLLPSPSAGALPSAASPQLDSLLLPSPSAGASLSTASPQLDPLLLPSSSAGASPSTASAQLDSLLLPSPSAGASPSAASPQLDSLLLSSPSAGASPSTASAQLDSPPLLTMQEFKALLHEALEPMLLPASAKDPGGRTRSLYRSKFQHCTVSAKFVGPPGVEDLPLLAAALADSALTLLGTEEAAAVLGPSVAYRGCVRLLQHVAVAVARHAAGDGEGTARQAVKAPAPSDLRRAFAELLLRRLPSGYKLSQPRVDVRGSGHVIPQPFAALVTASAAGAVAGSKTGAVQPHHCLSSLRLLLPGEGALLQGSAVEEGLAPSERGTAPQHACAGIAEGAAWHLRVVVSSPAGAAPLLDQRWTPAQLAELPLDEGGRRVLLLTRMASVPPAVIARAAETLPLLLVSVLRNKGGWTSHPDKPGADEDELLVPGLRTRGDWMAADRHGCCSKPGAGAPLHNEDELLGAAPVLLLTDATACDEMNQLVHAALMEQTCGNVWETFADHFVPLAWDLAAALSAGQRAAYVATHGADVYMQALRQLAGYLCRAGQHHCVELMAAAALSPAGLPAPGVMDSLGSASAPGKGGGSGAGNAPGGLFNLQATGGGDRLSARDGDRLSAGDGNRLSAGVGPQPRGVALRRRVVAAGAGAKRKAPGLIVGVLDAVAATSSA